MNPCWLPLIAFLIKRSRKHITLEAKSGIHFSQGEAFGIFLPVLKTLEFI